MPEETQLYKKIGRGKYKAVGPSDYAAFRGLTDGVWVIQNRDGASSWSCVAKACDLPEQPYDFASIMILHDELATFITNYKEDYAEKTGGRWYPSNSELAKGILLFLAKKSGNIGKERRKLAKERRIDLIL